jgi:hypothetical protein
VVVSKNRELTGDVLPDARFDHTMLEGLRHAKLVTVHRNDDDGVCFDLLPPKETDSSTWAKENAAHMQSLGYNAVKAPEVDEGLPMVPRPPSWIYA